MKPSTIPFDEPTPALDLELVGGVLEMVRNFAGEGMTIVIVTHEIGFIRGIADKVIFIGQSVIQEEGKSGRISSTPSNPHTAAFFNKIL